MNCEVLNCVFTFSTSTLYQHQLSTSSLGENPRPVTDNLTVYLKSQQLEKQAFQSSNNQVTLLCFYINLIDKKVDSPQY